MNLRTIRLIAALLLVGLPLVTGWAVGFPEGFFELPPKTVYIDPPKFSVPLYSFFTVLLFVALFFLWAPRVFGFNGQSRSDFTPFDWTAPPTHGHRFPAWGWVGIALIAASWPAAWTRPDWLGSAIDHTFFPLWLGYILTVDALTYRRAGTSPMSRHTVEWLAWFPASALTWWYFELLNRFIQNWVYLGIDHFSSLRYVLGSTLAFATVIPAVLTTAALLGTFDYFHDRFVRTEPGYAESVPRRGVWWGLVAAGSLGLTVMPWFPITLFALIWVAPLLILAGLLEQAGINTGVGHLLRGDWGPIVTLAVAALICGFFWELWNIYALPKWTYQVPWVDRFKLFEMPLAGYLGYLPFGPACWMFWLLLAPRAVQATPRPQDTTVYRGLQRR
ncbi:MAG: hypothetical protein MAG794_00450 [Gammaproteobacteria bacterium]|nr:hypothetical protein [Gammaproteobacteria bacterium]